MSFKDARANVGVPEGWKDHVYDKWGLLEVFPGHHSTFSLTDALLLFVCECSTKLRKKSLI